MHAGFYDWCLDKDAFKYATAMKEGGSGTWEIVG